MWRFIDLDKIDGFYSAAVFEAIGIQVGAGSSPETILFWRVSSPIVYLGYHQCVEHEINEKFCKKGGIGIVRRILGGGCGFCDEEQILFSVIGREDGVIPHDVQEAYSKVLGGVVNALESLGAGGKIEPARNAVYTHGRKISGNAQGRFHGAVLVNGSLLLDFDFELMDKVLKNPTKNLHPVTCAKEGMVTLRELGIIDLDAVKNSLRRGFEKALGVSSYEDMLTESESELAAVLQEKYLLNEWTYKMDNKRAMREKIKLKN
ncbi:MAG: biotin/lipoate A/B protein ligase family protein [Candidatus Methanoperedens sp.]|nr:biotin/lipoate A/B protein ligase family protein [Candidatus Methanoperedens sp.]